MEVEELRFDLSRRGFLSLSSATIIGSRFALAGVLGLAAGRAQAQLNTPAIFYAPHQDDEAIGMAGAIAEHQDAGRPVYLVLLTNGINQELLDLVNARLRNEGRAEITMEQMMWGRRSEFIAAGQALGVNKLFIIDDAQGIDNLLAYTNYAAFKNRIKEVVRYFENRFPLASHKLTASEPCYICNPQTPNEAHQACYEAGQELKTSNPPITDFAFFRIYEFFKPNPADRVAGWYILNLTPSWVARKRKALDEYKLWNPVASRYSLGYISAPELIDRAYTDPREFVDQ